MDSRYKGIRFESDTARELRENFPHAKRGLQSRGEEVPDIDGTPYWVECKRMRRVNPYDAYLQAEKNSDGRPPIAIVKQDRGPTTVTMSLDLFLKLTKGARG